jgi:dipeptidyl aminopeptidase/acylaminoacyl peptidase
MTMRTLLRRSTSLVCLALAGMVSLEFAGVLPAAEISPAEQEQTSTTATNRLDATSQQRRGRSGGPERGVYKSQITPHWFQNNTRFWYRNDLRDSAKEFIMVEAEHGTRRPAFDHQRLSVSLSKIAGEQFTADHLPFSEIEFVEEGKALRFEAAHKTWKCDLNSYECAELPGNSEKKTSSILNESRIAAVSDRSPLSSPELEDWGAEDSIPDSPFADETSPASQQSTNQPPAQDQRRQRRASERERSRRSPDGNWSAFIKDQNVVLRSEDDGKEYELSHDGIESNAYGRLEWAPDSKALVGWRIEPGDHKEVYLIQSSPPGGGRAISKARPYDLPGDKLTLYELSVFDVASRTQVKPEVDRFEHGWESPTLHWSRDQRHFYYVKVDRGHQRYRVIEVDSQTGALRNLIDEKTDTFVWTAHTEGLGLSYVNWLEKTDEMVYASERDGWRHLYLVDTKEAKIKNQITRGDFVVRGIDRIDEENRQIWFRAGGKNTDQDPYFIHFYRVNFDGTGLVALTEGNGNHSVQYSPDRKYIIDTYSRVDQAPVHELRRVSDCGLVSKFEEADISELLATGWRPPEVFVAKGRDGKTDIWGIICSPRDFDPNKKYPVLEQIYSGPQGSYVPKSFGGARRFSSLTDLGFVVVQMDGMGTANRSKAFHDICWKNVKDAGFPDRILWHKAVAAKYPWYDISRVGIYGNSAGGQNAAAAVLFHPEFYKAAVANSGCHDNRMDKASWNEQWMGYPVGPQYAECSNIENAARLQGYLMLVVGEIDDNVPPEGTFRFVDALIRAGKDFDLLFVPNGGHGAGGSYGQRRLQDFFLRHLQGTEPPNRNAGSS